MLGTGMLRLGDAATFCPEASASTLFQCAERSDSRAPGLPNKAENALVNGDLRCAEAALRNLLDATNDGHTPNAAPALASYATQVVPHLALRAVPAVDQPAPIWKPSAADDPT